jgi:hypothetical protein
VSARPSIAYEPAAPLTSTCVPGSSCTAAECIFSATCSATGECTGQPAPDGTFCATQPTGCTTGGVCLKGTCACRNDASTAADLGAADLSVKKPIGGDAPGCEMSGAARPAGMGLLILLAFGAAWLEVRRHRT